MRGTTPALCEEGKKLLMRFTALGMHTHTPTFFLQAGNMLGKLDDTPMSIFITGSLAAIAYLVYVAIST